MERNDVDLTHPLTCDFHAIVVWVEDSKALQRTRTYEELRLLQHLQLVWNYCERWAEAIKLLDNFNCMAFFHNIPQQNKLIPLWVFESKETWIFRGASWSFVTCQDDRWFFASLLSSWHTWRTGPLHNLKNFW